jgi:hypothetical protein
MHWNNEILCTCLLKVYTLSININLHTCCNPSLGSGPRGKPKSHISCSRECKRLWGNEPSHSQVNSHVGSWSPKFLKSECRGSKPIRLKCSLYHWKNLETYMSKMGSHDPFGSLKHKLWPKERSKVKLKVIKKGGR